MQPDADGAALLFRVDDRGVATLTLNRPDKHNALNSELISALKTAATEINANPSVRATVLTGAGASFCAGGDLGWMRAQMGLDRAARIAEAETLAHMLFALNTLNTPLIGRVNGPAYGGGLGMMAVCDAAITVDTARFGFTETRLGLIPATISPYVLARMGEGKARRVFMSARLFGAEEAVALDLAARAVPAEALDDAVAAEIKPYLTAAPEAVAAAKALARSLGPVIDSAVIRATAERLADVWETEAAQTRITAFLNKNG